MIELDRALEREQRTKGLSFMEESLFENISSYLKRLEKRALSLEGVDNDVLVSEIEHVKKRMAQLVDIRFRKMLDTAEENLLSDEQNIFKQTSLLKKQYHKDLLEPILKGEYSYEREGYIKAKVISPIPSFMDGELRKYGPYKIGDVDHFPEDIHAILYKHGFIE
ncbi:MAG TPA: hypothetical protein PK718_07790 [Candidatus Methanofastidiosa archaeon]|nr:hypothetical protein [Candidatus Methanofastidiosa archaeon]